MLIITFATVVRHYTAARTAVWDRRRNCRAAMLKQAARRIESLRFRSVKGSLRLDKMNETHRRHYNGPPPHESRPENRALKGRTYSRRNSERK